MLILDTQKKKITNKMILIKTFFYPFLTCFSPKLQHPLPVFSSQPLNFIFQASECYCLTPLRPNQTFTFSETFLGYEQAFLLLHRVPNISCRIMK